MNLILFILAVAFIIGFVLFIDYLIWSVYTWATAYFFPDIINNLTQPDFWPFVAALFLIGFIGRLIFGTANK